MDPTVMTGVMASPLGPIVALADERGIRGLAFSSRATLPAEAVAPPGGAILALLAEELEAYFQGRLRAFSVPLRLEGTPFRRRVWDRLLGIPYGQVRTYGEIAAELGRPGAGRAVGQAVRSNPVAILVPCHRVVAREGLGGYGGPGEEGLRLKRFLLRLESRAGAR